MIGKNLAHYKILEKLGAGGMGVVYRAQDTKLQREVALKTLPQKFSEDPERIARLQREARTLASIHHPNIASLYGLEEEGGQNYLVMELVEGEDLASRLDRGAIPVDEVINIALQIAEGLEAAHEKGIVHRDLKPANVKVTPGGNVKILDFGLARAYQSETAPDKAHSPAISEVITQTGVILGTAAYMSPEQARGKRVDHRSDIWGFGCLLYELLTGASAYPGETMSDTLASILQRDPDWEKLPKRLPTGIRRLLQRCLIKDAKNRLQAIGDARIAIQESLAEPSTQAEKSNGEAVSPQPTWRRVAPWLLLPLIAVVIWIVKPAKDPGSPPTVRFEIPLPEGQRLTSNFRHALAITADGRTLAFVSGTTSHYMASPDTTQIYLRSLDQQKARPVPGTENGLQPFFSPDGEWLGFIRGYRIMKVPVTGGEPVTVCDCGPDIWGTRRGPFGSSWGPDGSIVFAGVRSGLMRVAAAGGDADTLTRLDHESNEASHRLPQFLPDGTAVLFTVVRYKAGTGVLDWKRSRIFAQSLVTEKRELLIEGGSDARYLPTGHIIFAREGQLMAVRFDPDRLEVTGPEVPVLEGVSHSIHTGNGARETGAAHFAISATGILAYVAGSVFPEINTAVVWVDRQGREEVLEVDPQSYLCARVSADGREVLLCDNYVPRDVWLWDTERQVQRRQTFEGNHIWAIWGPGPDEFTVGSDREGPQLIYRKTIDSGPGRVEKLLTGTYNNCYASSWSPQGKDLVLVGWSNESGRDILIHTREGQTEPLLNTRFAELYPAFSPDGHWLVYTSNESGQNEVYVRPYPGPDRAVQISTRGGEKPAWSRDGREIFYRQGDAHYGAHTFYAVQFVAEEGRLTPGRPEKLFEGIYRWSNWLRSYDVAPDGRFLLIKQPDEAALSAAIDELFPTRIHVVQNWFAELLEKLPNDE